MNALKIGIFGGSFNPVHNGHVNLVREVTGAAGLDRIIVVPCGVSPFKVKAAARLAPADMRLEMCRLAFKEVPRVAVSGFEADKGGISYTIDTLRHFRGIYPDGRLYFIMGSDALPTLPCWKDFKGILENASVIAASRRSGEEKSLVDTAERLSVYGEIIIVPITPLEISSTEIREKILNNEDFSCYLSASVVEYIKNFQIYKE